MSPYVSQRRRGWPSILSTHVRREMMAQGAVSVVGMGGRDRTVSVAKAVVRGATPCSAVNCLNLYGRVTSYPPYVWGKVQITGQKHAAEAMKLNRAYLSGDDQGQKCFAKWEDMCSTYSHRLSDVSNARVYCMRDETCVTSGGHSGASSALGIHSVLALPMFATGRPPSLRSINNALRAAGFRFAFCKSMTAQTLRSYRRALGGRAATYSLRLGWLLCGLRFRCWLRVKSVSLCDTDDLDGHCISSGV
jgi:hypothetical protein